MTELDTTNWDQLEMRDPEGEATWKRIPEREPVKFPVEAKVGERIKFRRAIARAGYRVQPTDCPIEEMNRRALEIIQARCHAAQPREISAVWDSEVGAYRSLVEKDIEDIPIEVIKQVLGSLAWFPRGDVRTGFGQGNLARNGYPFIDEGVYPPLRWVYWYARRQWWLKQARGGFRTFWYVEYDDLQEATVTRRPVKQIGRYCAGGGGGYYDDYDPPYLAVTTYQQVYEVRRIHQWIRGLRYMRGYPGVMLVHPADVEGEFHGDNATE